MAETGDSESPAANPNNPETTSPPPPPTLQQPQTPSQPQLQPPPQTSSQPLPPPQQPQSELLPPKRPQQLESSPNPTTPSATDSKDVTPATLSSRLTEPDYIYIPSHSRWFSWNSIHESEVRFLPEFFDGRSPSKNPRTYKYYRNSIIHRFRDNPTKKITFTEARKTIIGDVGSIRRVFDFLETWGLINYTANSSKSLLKWEEKESKSTSASAAPQNADANGTAPTDFTAAKKRLCSACKSACSIACFVSDKYDLTLCARCYVRGNFRVGMNTSDFRRVEISEEVKTDWTDKETLHLLEALMHYGDDWKKVAEHVGGRSAKECVARFVKLPFGEQFMGPPVSAEVDNEPGSETMLLPSKRMRLTPLADASNPIMAQAAFLSALAGKEVAELAAHAAVTALSENSEGIMEGSLASLPGVLEKQETDGTSNGHAKDTLERALVEARSQLEEEAQDLERAVSDVAIETREFEDKIARFEERDLQMEKEWQQLMQLKNLIFFDQLTLLLNKVGATNAGETIGEEVMNVRAE
ncbi:PREDICTED: SWI/SNF complex subunit SWI3B-like [Nicotiana attenuata]|uniref:Swisnf complex subunit swi3b n=1 Tax=Nicotiana attenuata TaxID=49451 RepID=A0A1J6J9K3_NICAT|nr:PREDICTED: SWI/SNF complex subunit SWI3B-like [Nicotiana attenuata]OIT03905.1 swisnf complex subunit swi3b [Nicotiana attenuata]